MKKLFQYYQIIKRLKKIQIIYRAKYIFKRKTIELFSPFFTKKYYQDAKENLRNPIENSDIFLTSQRKYYKNDLTKIFDYNFNFLNEEKQFNHKIEWHRSDLNEGTRLWKLNLHYHEWLIDVAELYVKTKNKEVLFFLLDTIHDWIEKNPIGTKGYGKDNWNSYCLSLRIVAWIKIYARLDKIGLKELFDSTILTSLKAQIEFLSHNLELDILGNHLVKNWKALIWGSTFFNDQSYIKKIDKIENKFILSQFTKNGLHEELSPMYAGIVLEDFIEVYCLNKNKKFLDLIELMTVALNPLVHQKEYSLFNDSVNNNEVSVSDLEKLLKRYFNKRFTFSGFFNSSGYIGVKNKNQHIIFDFANATESPQPGHLKCDQMSFEFWLKNKKVITNSGVFEYSKGNRRTYSRSTSSSNTLSLINYNQSAVVDSFRVMKRAKTGYTILNKTDSEFHVKGFVDGFDFKNTIHHREVKYNSKQLEIHDSFDSLQELNAEIYFHFHPQVKVVKKDNFFSIELDKKLLMKLFIDSVNTELISTEFFPEFGKVIPKQTIKVSNIRKNDLIKSKFIINEEYLPNL